jgi:ABC-type transporter MlaC component
VLRSADPTRGLEEPRRAIRLLITEVFDFREAAAVALGPAWRSRTAKEQDEFIHLFADLLERGYIAAFSSKARLAGGISVQYLSESVFGESATVPTRVLTRAGEDLSVDYHLVRRGERWAVRDVVIDGVSMVANYRAQFARILGTSTFTDLVAKMSRGGPSPSPTLVVAAAPAAVATPPAPGPTPAGPAVPAPDASRKSPASAEPTSPSPATPPAARTEVASPARPADQTSGMRTELKLAPGPPEPGAGKLEQSILKAPVKPEPVTPAPPALSKTRVQYWVQLGTFQTLAAAKRLVERLRPQVASISTSPASSRAALGRTRPLARAGRRGNGAGAAVSRVRVGPFEDQALATAKLREPRRAGYLGRRAHQN